MVSGTAVAAERDDRNLLVERLDERYAEPLVLAGGEKQVGHVIERRQFLV